MSGYMMPVDMWKIEDGNGKDLTFESARLLDRHVPSPFTNWSPRASHEFIALPPQLCLIEAS
jgi:hypothetical protein